MASRCARPSATKLPRSRSIIQSQARCDGAKHAVGVRLPLCRYRDGLVCVAFFIAPTRGGTLVGKHQDGACQLRAEFPGTGEPRPQARSSSVLIHHGDHGGHYVSIKYAERLAEIGIEPSVGSVGNGHDTALAAAINGLYEGEIVHRRGLWRSFETVEIPSNGRLAKASPAGGAHWKHLARRSRRLRHARRAIGGRVA